MYSKNGFSTIKNNQPPLLTESPMATVSGKDELNLAEFPLTKLGGRDNREILVYEGWAVDKLKGPYKQVWTVRGAAGLGLPNELGDRVILALLSLSTHHAEPSRKVEFSFYQLLKLLALETEGQALYLTLEKVLRQLTGIFIESEQAFFDKASNKRITSREAFHLVESLWLRKYERDSATLAAESAQAYIIWGREIWKNLQAGYIKKIDLSFYYSLSSPLARRLFRFLDKRMHHQNEMEIDIFELSGRLGQARYHKPSEVHRKLQPAIAELIERKFLSESGIVKRDKYTRLRFVKIPTDEREQIEQRRFEREQRQVQIQQHFGVGEGEQQLWAQVLAKLQERLTSAQFAIMENSVLLSIEEQRATLCLANAFAVSWVQKQTNVMQAIQEQLAKETGSQQFQIELVDPKSVDKSVVC